MFFSNDTKTFAPSIWALTSTYKTASEKMFLSNEFP